MLTCSLIVLQTLMLAYITFGPSLMGLCPTYAHILPSRQEIGPQTASAIVATLLLINFPPIANSLSLDSLSVRMLPTLFMRAFRPTILSIAPACLLYLLSSSSQPFLASIVHAFYRMYAIFVISHATVFVWMLSQSIQDAHFVSAPSDAIDHITATGPGVHTPMLLAQIRRHLRSADSLKAFPVFLDATGQTWRSLHTHLIFALQKVNADLANAQLHPQNLFISSPRSSPTLSARQAQPAIHACDIIRMVIPACTSYDSYGVAHGNIPDLLVILLRLKEATTNYITSHDMQAEANDEGSAITRMAMSLKGIFKTGAGIVALDDALSLCVYSIVGEYREYLSRLLGGGELGWDRGCDVLLRSFLDFQVP